MSIDDRKSPIVYSCSGCSSAAQMANYVAICLDRAQHAEMSCIAGVGGDVPSLVRIAKSGRKIVAIDGCPLHCVLGCLARHEVKPDMHIILTKIGVKKRYHMAFSEDEAAKVFRRIVAALQANGPTGKETDGATEAAK